MSVVGADGCPSGWFFFELSGDWYRSGIAISLADLLADCPDAESVLVDVPIGLRDAPPAARACDVEVRRALSPVRHSTVFPVPARAAVYAGGYQLANRINRETLREGLSKQTWGIAPKIREADLVLRLSTRAKRIVREVHPEVCFWALAGGRPMKNNKKTGAGIEERIALMSQYRPDAAAMFQSAVGRTSRGMAGPDDIVDALVAAITAAHPEVRTMPAEPERDCYGLPMEMVHVAVGSAHPVRDEGTVG